MSARAVPAVPPPVEVVAPGGADPGDPGRGEVLALVERLRGMLGAAEARGALRRMLRDLAPPPWRLGIPGRWSAGGASVGEAGVRAGPEPDPGPVEVAPPG